MNEWSGGSFIIMPCRVTESESIITLHSQLDFQVPLLFCAFQLSVEITQLSPSLIWKPACTLCKYLERGIFAYSQMGGRFRRRECEIGGCDVPIPQRRRRRPRRV